MPEHLAFAAGVAAFAFEDHLHPRRRSMPECFGTVAVVLLLGGVLSALLNLAFDTTFFELLGRAAFGWAWALLTKGLFDREPASHG